MVGCVPPTTPAPAPRAVCSDVGAHFRQPELDRWFPWREAGSVLAAGGNRLHLSRCGTAHPMSTGGRWVCAWQGRQGSPWQAPCWACWEGTQLSPDQARVASTSHSLLPSVPGPLPGWVLSLQSDQGSHLPVRSEGSCQVTDRQCPKSLSLACPSSVPPSYLLWTHGAPHPPLATSLFSSSPETSLREGPSRQLQS